MSYTFRPDILLVNEYDIPEIVIETKKVFGPESDWAREQAKQHARILGAKYAMAVTPEWVFLWRAPALGGVSEHSWSAPAGRLLEPLFSELGFDVQTLSGNGFQDLVALWLRDLGNVLRSGKPLPEELEWLEGSGAADLIERGYVRQGVEFEAVR